MVEQASLRRDHPGAVASNLFLTPPAMGSPHLPCQLLHCLPALPARRFQVSELNLLCSNLKPLVCVVLCSQRTGAFPLHFRQPVRYLQAAVVAPLKCLSRKLNLPAPSASPRGLAFQALEYLCGSLWTLSDLPMCRTARSIQMRPDQCHVERRNHLPCLAANASADAAQNRIRLLHACISPRTCIESVICRDSQVLFHGAATQPGVPHCAFVLLIISPELQHLALSALNFILLLQPIFPTCRDPSKLRLCLCPFPVLLSADMLHNSSVSASKLAANTLRTTGPRTDPAGLHAKPPAILAWAR